MQILTQTWPTLHQRAKYKTISTQCRLCGMQCEDDLKHVFLCSSFPTQSRIDELEHNIRFILFKYLKQNVLVNRLMAGCRNRNGLLNFDHSLLIVVGIIPSNWVEELRAMNRQDSSGILLECRSVMVNFAIKFLLDRFNVQHLLSSLNM